MTKHASHSMLPQVRSLEIRAAILRARLQVSSANLRFPLLNESLSSPNVDSLRPASARNAFPFPALSRTIFRLSPRERQRNLRVNRLFARARTRTCVSFRNSQFLLRAGIIIRPILSGPTSSLNQFDLDNEHVPLRGSYISYIQGVPMGKPTGANSQRTGLHIIV